MAGSFGMVGSGGQRVIALHGCFGSALGWGHLADYLNTDQFCYVFPDLRGYGSRKDEPGDFTMAEAAADALRLADDLGWDRFSLIGHSMSGVAVQHVLAQAPHRVRRLGGVAAATPASRGMIVNYATGSRLTPAFVDLIVRHSLAEADADAFGAYLESWA